MKSGSQFNPRQGCKDKSIHPTFSSLKPILNWANVCSPEHTSDTSMNYDSFLN